MTSAFTLREMTLEDAPAVAALGRHRQTAAGLVEFQAGLYQEPAALRHDLALGFGVVAEAPGDDGLVGMGLASLGAFQFEGWLCPYIYLHGVRVHPGHRRRGIATAMHRCCIEAGRRQAGDEAVVFASIAHGNLAGRLVARSWSTQRLDGRIQTAAARVRVLPPRPFAGLDVRPAEAGDYEEVSQKQNAFYQSHNLYAPVAAQALAAGRAVSAPRDAQPGDYYIALNGRREVLAGLSLTGSGRHSPLRLVSLARPARVANRILRLIPPDGVVRHAFARWLWHAPGHPAAAAHLWETVRWLYRERADLLTITLDARDPLARLARQLPYAPRRRFSLHLAAPAPMRAERLIYAQGL